MVWKINDGPFLQKLQLELMNPDRGQSRRLQSLSHTVHVRCIRGLDRSGLTPLRDLTTSRNIRDTTNYVSDLRT